MRKNKFLAIIIICISMVTLAAGTGIHSFAEGKFTFPGRDEWREEKEHTRIEYLEDAFTTYGIRKVTEDDIVNMKEYNEKAWNAFWTYHNNLRIFISRLCDEHRILETERDYIIDKYVYVLSDKVLEAYEGSALFDKDNEGYSDYKYNRQFFIPTPSE